MLMTSYYRKIRSLDNNLTDLYRINNDINFRNIAKGVQDNIKIKEDTFYLINSEEMKDLNIMWKYLIKGSFNDTLTSLHNEMIKDLDMKRLVYIINFTCFIGLIISLYFLFIIPHQVATHKSIYDTKNMLSIIPIEVLAELKNIQKLLNIKMDNENN